MMNDFEFDDGTFLVKGLETLNSRPEDVFCKVGDISVYYFPRPVKHKIIGYDLLFWIGLARPEGNELSSYDKYTSTITGRSRFSFNDVPYLPRSKNEFFKLIHKHFTSTELLKLRNRDDVESLSVSRYTNTFDVEVLNGDELSIASNIEFKEDYKLDDTLTHVFISSVLTYTLIKRDVITDDVSLAEKIALETPNKFKDHLDLLSKVKDSLIII
jgi:hypothetical protein